MHPKVVLFDLDDTLYSRNQTFMKFIDNFITNYSLAIDDEGSSLLRDTLYKLDCKGYKSRRDLFSEIISQFTLRNSPNVDELIQFYCNEFPNCIESTPELYEILEWLLENDIGIGIVTNGPLQMQNQKVDKLKIRQYMSTIIISEEVGITKPDPKIFDLALNQIDVENVKALYIGDNPSTDVKGANDAGLLSVWLSNGQMWDIADYKPAIIIKEITEIPCVIKSLS